MKAFYCDHFVLPLPQGHRFPMRKYALLREGVAGDPRVEMVVPEAAGDEALLRVHTRGYLEAVVHGSLTPADARRIGFPWSPGLVERSRRSVGGTLAAARTALAEGIAVNLAGGTHHAFADRGEGFCVFNDVAVAARESQWRARAGGRGGARRVAILDLDVHQGNGTAAIFRDDPSVLTISVHGEGNYPFHKEESDLDISLPDGTGDDGYLDAVEGAVRIMAGWAPDLVLFLAGADPYAGDKLGRLSVSFDGLAERDEMVFDACDRAGAPVAVVMSGGYAPRVEDIVRIHRATVLSAAQRWASAPGAAPQPLTGPS